MTINKIILLILMILLLISLTEAGQNIFKTISTTIIFFISSILHGLVVLFDVLGSIILATILAIIFIFSLPILFIVQHFIVKKDKENVD